MLKIIWAGSCNDATRDLTPEQIASVTRIHGKHNLVNTVEIHPMFAGDGGVMLNTGTMWIGIETDGYAHT